MTDKDKSGKGRPAASPKTTAAPPTGDDGGRPAAKATSADAGRQPERSVKPTTPAGGGGEPAKPVATPAAPTVAAQSAVPSKPSSPAVSGAPAAAPAKPPAAAMTPPGAAKPAAPPEPARPAPEPARPAPPAVAEGAVSPSPAPPAAARAAEPPSPPPPPAAKAAEPPSPPTPPPAVGKEAPSRSPEAPAAAKVAAEPPSPPPVTPAASPPVTPAAAPAAKLGAAPPPPPQPAKPVHVPRERLAPHHDVQAVISADHRDPFGFLGVHWLDREEALVVRCFAPEAKAVEVIDAATGRKVGGLERLHEDGLFGGPLAGRRERFPYRLRIETAIGTSEIDDPYRFPPILSDADVLHLAEGDHLDSYRTLGAHARTVDGIAGTAFTVWAPHAGRVAVIGEFNNWDGRCHGMRLRHDCGVWEIFLPAVVPGQLYKYEIKSGSGLRLTDKCDPYAFQVERLPGSAAIVTDLGRFPWSDARWMKARAAVEPHRAPISIYEVHLASWRRKPEEGHRCLSYRELADDLVGYVDYMQFSHVALLPICEYDLDASQGYAPFAPYAPTSRYGTADDFRLLVDRLHGKGIGVILDWVPVQFSDNPHGLRDFDGSHLYEPADPRQRHLPGSNLLTYDFGRREVANYLLSNALFWLDAYHIDALHIGDLARILYLDYGRSRGEWQPNRFGGHEYLEAVDFVRRLNEAVYSRFSGAFSSAEETSGWPRLSHPTFLGGLGFGFKWHPNWVREVLRYLSRNPVHRKYYHDEIVQGSATVFNENHVLALSHGNVASGRGSLLRRMPGDPWSRFANLRLFYAFIYTHPGKKLMFMGNELAQEREWNADISLDWHLAAAGPHAGIQTLVRDLNILYRTTPALHEGDCDTQGFAWIDCADADQGVIAFLRSPVRPADAQPAGKASAGHTAAAGKSDPAEDAVGSVVVVCHFTPVVRRDYRLGVPTAGFWEERLNTDAAQYGGSNQGNSGGVEAEPQPWHGHPYSLRLTLPPFAAVVIQQRR